MRADRAGRDDKSGDNPSPFANNSDPETGPCPNLLHYCFPVGGARRQKIVTLHVHACRFSLPKSEYGPTGKRMIHETQ